MRRILYVHTTGAFGGASRSLVETIRAFPPGAVAAYFVTQRGTVEPYFTEVGQGVVTSRGICQWNETQYGHYRGFRWLLVLRELAYVLPTLRALVAARRRWPDIDAIHVNEVTGVVGAALAKLLYRKPVVVHVRSVLRSDRDSWRYRLFSRAIRKVADAVVAIDENVRRSLDPAFAALVIHNGFTPSLAAQPYAFAPGEAPDAGAYPALRVAFVGNLLAVKGILDLAEAARVLAGRGIRVDVLVAGDDIRRSGGLVSWLLKATGLAQDSRAELEARLDRYSLRPRFHLLGFVQDISSVYRAADVVCFPSHFDAPGRPILEAAFFGVPAVAAIREPQRDTLVHGVTGLAVAPKDIRSLAAALETLARDADLRRRMGEQAKIMARENFDPSRNSALLLELYERICRRSGPG